MLKLNISKLVVEFFFVILEVLQLQPRGMVIIMMPFYSYSQVLVIHWIKPVVFQGCQKSLKI